MSNQPIEEIQKEYREKLSQIADISPEKAKELYLEELDKEFTEEKNERINRMREFLEKTSEKMAQEILATTLQRITANEVSDLTTTTIKINDESLKGRIIGKEGRNIRCFENATGTNLIVDDTPGEITISSFDPIRREIAARSMKELIEDGRIQPAKIEEIVENQKKEMEEVIWEAGQEITTESGVSDLPVDIINLIGRFRFRTSYGQNMADHTLEVVKIGVALATELKADVELTRKACLLHDIGKAVTGEIEGPHDEVGAKLARQHGIEEIVVRSFEGHHTGDFPNLEAIIVHLADSISAMRPGARRDSHDRYVNHVKELEELAKSFSGVEDAFAISAGREVRVIVKPEKVMEQDMVKLAYDLARKIHEQVKNFPGQIKVNVIRESRATAFATSKRE